LIYALEDSGMFRQEVENIQMDDEVYVSDDRLHQIRLETLKDNTLQTLMKLISQGWPDDKLSVPLAVREYWSYRDELTMQNGLAFRGTRIIIPTSMRQEMIRRAHAAHLGIQSTTNTAREIMYWPRMHTDLVDAVQRCEICQEASPAQTKEPLMTYPLPTAPWQSVCVDCMEVQGVHYGVIVDVYSDYLDVFELPDLKTDFSRQIEANICQFWDPHSSVFRQRAKFCV
jgi:hypothetical protein